MCIFKRASTLVAVGSTVVINLSMEISSTLDKALGLALEAVFKRSPKTSKGFSTAEEKRTLLTEISAGTAKRRCKESSKPNSLIVSWACWIIPLEIKAELRL